MKRVVWCIAAAVYIADLILIWRRERYGWIDYAWIAVMIITAVMLRE